MGAVVLAAALLGAACSGSDTEPDAASTPAAEQSSQDRAVLEIPSLAMFDDEPVDEESEVVELDLDAQFSAVIDSLGTSYVFVAELTAPGGEVVSVDGRRVDNALDYSVLAAERSVRTVVIGGDVWVTTEGETRVLDGRSSSNGDPLETLADPVEVAAHPELEGAFSVTYPASVVGRTDIETVDVIVNVDGTQVQFVYSDEVASMITTLDPVTDPEPIVAPE